MENVVCVYILGKSNNSNQVVVATETVTTRVVSANWILFDDTQWFP